MYKKKEPDEGDIYVRELARKKYEGFKEISRVERENQVHIKRTSRYTRLTFWLIAIPLAILVSLLVFEYMAIYI